MGFELSGFNKVYDSIIIDSGSAEITSTVYAARKKMSFLVVTNVPESR
ncbi:MAG: hypothetical protein QXD66_04065 [Candidatus Nezhaarchaeales archaeon]